MQREKEAVAIFNTTGVKSDGSQEGSGEIREKRQAPDQWFSNFFWFAAHCKTYKYFLAYLVYKIKNILIYFKL
jgi:hypothetical protein